ncbi:YceI family protein [Anaeromyxobacter diazotrophicus]|uniref:Polyisoprenoid-binding protein n=1 Tax=Anaeromyxobacter diazotrophicus TaxID=2590199 RepID=A0A7I9VJY3_9BACT|nr:YceI family protein [Anaeromyxobacter diazotrophicus]GEJ56714.1 polyisoprenoid-binding protein [Anaeromyxobacter diazotrophicus]
MRRTFALALAAALPLAAAAETTTWNIDPAHSDSSFAVKHLVVSTVRGHFGKTTGTLHLDDKDLSKSSAEATVDTTTIDTRVADRDADLKSANFFDVAKYPEMTFKSTKVQKQGKGKLKVTGDLTIKGTTKPVVFDVTYSQPVKGMKGEERRGFNGTTRINRRDFGLTWSKTIEAGPVVADNVDITLDLEAVKAQPAEEAAKAKAANAEEKK